MPVLSEEAAATLPMLKKLMELACVANNEKVPDGMNLSRKMPDSFCGGSVKMALLLPIGVLR